MKEFKKTPRQQLEKFSTIFMQLGLVLALFVVFISLEYETEQTAMVVDIPRGDEITTIIDFDSPIVYVKHVDKKSVQRQERVVTTIIDNPTVVDDSHEDTVIINEPIENEDPLIDVAPEEVPEDEDIKKEDDPTLLGITFVSKIPVFAGCENLSEKEGRKCFDKKINKLIRRHFDTDLANELGLKKGKNRILTQFVIDKQGNVTDVQIRAPHSRLKKETQRIIKKIPTFTPGENQGKPVNVRYSLPINFQVE